jgi:fatty acid/phospholipid biosynthesis enzyme
MVEDPVEVTSPVHSSRSAGKVLVYCLSLVHVLTPPPETEETVGVDDPMFTARINASPAMEGVTDNDERPVPSLEASEPTAEMVAALEAVINASTAALTEAGDCGTVVEVADDTLGS